MGYPERQTALESTTLEKSNLQSEIATLQLKSKKMPQQIILADFGLPSVAFFNVHSYVRLFSLECMERVSTPDTV